MNLLTKPEIFRNRIQKVQNLLKEEELLLLFGNTHAIRNRDVEYKFRQDSDFYYLTGLEEEDSILYLKKNDSGIFALPKDKEKEIWTGIRHGKEKIAKLLNLKNAYLNTEFDSQIGEIFKNTEVLYYFLGKNSQNDSRVIPLLHRLQEQSRLNHFYPTTIKRPSFLHALRATKQPEEVGALMESAKITAAGHLEIMRASKPEMYEYELEAILEHEYKKFGSWGGGYGHIVATGKNACILHYTSNSEQLKNGELVLVDSGAEKYYYTADVTRCFPVGKKFTDSQKIIYEIVLAAQKNAIALCKSGVVYSDIHDKTVDFFISVLKDLRLLKGTEEKIKETGEYKKFYMHKTGHFLGMDVHDVGKYFEKNESVKLQAGNVITIEPGLYFDPEDETIPKEFRGIGIRIEDDVLIEKNSAKVLTSMIPKEISEIEALKG